MIFCLLNAFQGVFIFISSFVLKQALQAYNKRLREKLRTSTFKRTLQTTVSDSSTSSSTSSASSASSKSSKSSSKAPSSASIKSHSPTESLNSSHQNLLTATRSGSGISIKPSGIKNTLTAVESIYLENVQTQYDKIN